MNRASRHVHLTTLAIAAFAKHQRRSEAPDRWVLQAHDGTVWQSNYAVEILVLRGSKLLVHGDVELVCFDGFSGGDPQSVVRWIGQHATADEYVVQKAARGTGREMIRTLDEDVAFADLEQERDTCRRDHPHDDPEPCEFCRACTTASEYLRHGEPLQRVLMDLCDGIGSEGDSIDSETVARIGVVPDARVIYAHAAVRRLCAIFDEVSHVQTCG